ISRAPWELTVTLRASPTAPPPAKNLSPFITEPFDSDPERRITMSGGSRNSIVIGGAVVLASFGLVLLEKHTNYKGGSQKVGNVESQLEFPEEKNRATLLDIQEKIVEDRIDFSRRVAQEIIDQRLTLWEAAKQLEQLDQSSAPICQEFY